MEPAERLQAIGFRWRTAAYRKGHKYLWLHFCSLMLGHH